MKYRPKIIQRINTTKNWFFEKINKIDKPLANLTEMKNKKTQISKIRNETRDNEKKKTPRKFCDSSETTLRTYIPIN
jgi:hypothetical protein